VPDTTPPTAPAGLTATAASSSQVNLAWGAATDNVGVTQYRVERCAGAGCTTFVQIGTATGTTFSDTGLAASTTYGYQVRAADVAGNASDASNRAEATTAAPPTTLPGLVGAWAFSEGTGTTTADASGNGNTGTVTGATWTGSGRHGGALVFDGVTSAVRIPASASLNPTAGMTVSAWVQPTVAQSSWRAIVQKEADAYFLHASGDGPLRPAGGGTFVGNVNHASAPTAIGVNAWTHLAVTYDGTTVRLYVDGTQVATRVAGGAIQSTTQPLWIGSNSYGENFVGLIDEVRVYSRALTPAEIQTDAATPIAQD
jgi:hypothetical protein